MLFVICVIMAQELKFDPETAVHFLDVLPKSVDVGNYKFVFEVSFFVFCVLFWVELMKT